MHGIHEDRIELEANKGLGTHRRTVGLVCHLEALEAFLCPLVREDTRLASVLCSKHG
jgi:hypothetical protein